MQQLFSLRFAHHILAFYFLPEVAKEGGTAPVFKETFNSKEESFTSYASFDLHAFVLNNPPILCVTVFRPPQHSTSLIKKFSQFFSIIYTFYNRILITGDFNLHIDNISDPVVR